MEDQYGGMPDLRQYIDGRPLFPAISQPPEMMPCQYPYDMLVFRSDTGVAAPSDGGGGGAGRWPRQETLTLLEIRSRLDPKFKEANQKGPLWDEVSRILWQEHGYQRSGKKCREKFENLYKYYKKTKEGKAGRQDGKHYRFFRQLEALYGAAADHQTKASDAFSFPDSCDAASSYCSESNVVAADDEEMMEKRKGKRSMKAEIEASVEAQMKEMMEKQEAWMERMTTVIEGKEAERLRREEQWRRQDAARIDGEQKMWASERAWVESRDAALMEAFNRLAGKQLQPPPQLLPPPPQPQQTPVWPELRSGMELRFGENGMMSSEESTWDEISAKMAAASTAGGGGSSGRERLDQAISDYLIKCSKKRRENAKASTYGYPNRDPITDQGVTGTEGVMRQHGGGNRSSGDEGLFRYFIGDSCQRYYDLK